jgi:hypothetical protein
MYILDGKPLHIDREFTHDGFNYPANWLRVASPADREAIGITEVPDPVRPDDRFYWVDEHNVGTPKDLVQLKKDWIEQTKQTARSLLNPTDWYVIRSIEEPGTTPADVTTYRKAIRTRSSEIDAAINACKDVPALQALVTVDLNWPLTAEEKARRDRETPPA